MKKVSGHICGLLLCYLFILPSWAQKDKVKYVKKYYDPVLEEMREQEKQLEEEKESVTDEILTQQKKKDKKEREERQVIRFDFNNVAKPASPEVFKSAFHFPPIPQYRTGTCWSFATTSFLESEIALRRTFGKCLFRFDPQPNFSLRECQVDRYDVSSGEPCSARFFHQFKSKYLNLFFPVLY